MNSKNKTMYMPDAAPIPAPTLGGLDPTKCSPPLDFISTVSRPSGPDPTSTLAIPSDVPRNNQTPVTTNTLVDPTEAFKTVINDIIELITLLAAPMFYEPETVLLQMEELR